MKGTTYMDSLKSRERFDESVRTGGGNRLAICLNNLCQKLKNHKAC
jgi:hypothetical protein